MPTEVEAKPELNRWVRREGPQIVVGEDLAVNGAGELTGYVATWDLDREGERFARGAFARSIQQAIPAGKVMLLIKHILDGADVGETVGQVIEAKEDERGLWIRAAFSASASGQEARTKTAEGLVKYMSVGFRPIRWEGAPVNGKVQVVYKEAEFVDATLTNRPVNPKAVILSAKTETSAVSTQHSALAAASGNTGKSEPGGTAPAPASTPPAPPVATAIARDVAQRRRRLRMLIRE